nr:hypothetical protein [Serinicoccus marinus]
MDPLVGADQLHPHEPRPRLLRQGLPGRPRLRRRVDQVGDHPQPDAQLVGREGERRGIPLRAQLLLGQTTPHERLLHRVHP